MQRYRKQWKGKTKGQKGVIVEDVRSAEVYLKKQNIDCDRLTHTEALSSNQEITRQLRNEEYTVLWISSPEDWHCKHQKSTPKMRNLSKWIKLAVLSNLMVILFGIPN